MFKKPLVVTAALAAVFAMPLSAQAADERELAEIRDQLKQLKDQYEARIQALEKRLQNSVAIKEVGQQEPGKQEPSQQQLASTAPAANTPQAAASATGGATAAANAFNPAISLILGGTYANLSKDPGVWRIRGFMPPGEEVGPGTRSFNLGESELKLSANVDHLFSGQLTFALGSDNSASVEEAFFQTKTLGDGLNVKGGRFLSSIGYLNGQHAHVWDFVDAPLAYQAFLGGQYKQDGLQLKWLAPTERFLEIGMEVGNGSSFPGTERNKNGVNSAVLFARMGDDIGSSASWGGGLSYLRTRAENRSFDDADNLGANVINAFNGNSGIWIADGVYKWAPTNSTSFKLQGEYFRRRESGTLSQDNDSGDYLATQSGWYMQGVYQFL